MNPTDKRYHRECRGCPDGHPSFWKTVVESPQWKLWSQEQRKRFGKLSDGKKVASSIYDIDEVTECGWISPKHFQDFIKFVTKKPCPPSH